jgi:hypothetical protein
MDSGDQLTGDILYDILYRCLVGTGLGGWRSANLLAARAFGQRH